MRDTLGGATGAADQLPAGLLTSAGEAFTAGLQMASGISAIALAAVAAAAAVVLRPIATGPRPSAP